jgi:hypothetical protein
MHRRFLVALLVAACAPTVEPVPPAAPVVSPSVEPPFIEVSPPPDEPAPAPSPPLALVVSFEDVLIAPGKHEVFALVPALAQRVSLTKYDDPGACILESKAWVANRRPGARRGGDRVPLPRPDGAWLTCGAAETGSVGVAATERGLQIGDDVLVLPPGSTVQLPKEAPLAPGAPRCALGTPTVRVSAAVQVKPSGVPEERRRALSLRLSDRRLDVPLFEITDIDDCSSLVPGGASAVSLLLSCRDNRRWGHYSETSALMRVVQGRLVIQTRRTSIDDHLQSRSVTQLPCGAGVTFARKTIAVLKARADDFCAQRCHGPEGACLDGCAERLGDELGEVTTDQGSACVRVCNERANDCEGKCLR